MQVSQKIKRCLYFFLQSKMKEQKEEKKNPCTQMVQQLQGIIFRMWLCIIYTAL